MSVSHWSPLREFLSPSAELLHDFKDQLRSGKASTGYDMQSHADELAELLDELSIDSVRLIGTSYGAEVALLFALSFPERCETLVLVGEHDILKTPAYSRLIHERIRGSHFDMIPGAGHAAVIEQPQAVAQGIEAFFSS